MTRPQTTRPRDDRGSAVIELPLMIAALIALGLLIVTAGRVEQARNLLAGVAADAARAASQARTAAGAQTAAEREAAVSLTAQNITCQHLAVRVTGRFNAPPGTAATVTATVSCTLLLHDLHLPGGTDRRLSASATDPLDTWSGRP
jgi:Flp pilus assembly protein TadG